jgi:exodeoxyribonuclease-3
MKIATWNVNSVRARMPNITKWLEAAAPDVLLLQEIKSETDTFPRFEFEAMGYKCAVAGQKSYNGVALLSRLPMTDVLENLPGDASDAQARYIEATVGGFRVARSICPTAIRWVRTSTIINSLGCAV